MTRAQIRGLDGIRGLLALYVVVHHCWLLTYPGYPANTGPAWLGWLVHGRLAVVAFIVLSGFSLATGPARDGWRLGGVRDFARRRARRILPPYWAALALSLVIVSDPPGPRSAVVHILLLQDLVAVRSPNGAFWSIAVEAGLYVAFPVLLLLRRRAGTTLTLAAVTVPVIVAGLLGLAAPGRPIGYTLEFLPLFTAGVVAAGARVTPRLAALAAAPVLLLIAVQGPVWTVRHYYWVDLAAGPAIALFLAAIAGGRPAALVRFLDSRPLRTLGGFSYSLYLIHLPVIALLTPAFAAVPVCLLLAWIFASLLETSDRNRFHQGISMRALSCSGTFKGDLSRSIAP
ncbi:acyltransferase family protein [Paractinoplanes rishiriensis]|nr:acyltransferase [Actinoplanes rishiriensis]